MTVQSNDRMCAVLKLIKDLLAAKALWSKMVGLPRGGRGKNI